MNDEEYKKYKIVKQGKQAYRLNQPLDSCPYKTKEESELWKSGWLHVSAQRRRYRLVEFIFESFKENFVDNNYLENADFSPSISLQEVEEAFNKLNLKTLLR